MQIPDQIALVLLIVTLVNCANNSSICGKLKLDETKLVPTGQTLPGQIPWHVSIYRYSDYTCGGSIVSPRLVISSAHLLAYWEVPSVYRFTTGLHDLKNTVNGITYNVTEIIVHPEFMQTASNSDIAMLRSASDISFDESTNVFPICLPKGQTVKDFTVKELLNKSGILVGWEHPEQFPSSSALKWKALSVIDLDSCRKKIPDGFHYMLDNEILCATRQNNGANINLGDDGGGLVFLRDDVWYLQGVFSFAPIKLLDNDKAGYNQSGAFGFTNIARYITWINEHFTK